MRCLGLNTFDPFRLIGGTVWDHPTKDEIIQIANNQRSETKQNQKGGHP